VRPAADSKSNLSAALPFPDGLGCTDFFSLTLGLGLETVEAAAGDGLENLVDAPELGLGPEAVEGAAGDGFVVGPVDVPKLELGLAATIVSADEGLGDAVSQLVPK
jgi:hypothetical protein